MSSVSSAALRFALVLCGAAAGSYAGRVIGAARRGETLEPYLRLDRSTLVYADVVPGYLAVELLGKFMNLQMGSAAIVAAAGGAVAALIDGPLLERPPAADTMEGRPLLRTVP